MPRTRTHEKKTRSPKRATGAKESAPAVTRPRPKQDNDPPRNWAYADANAPAHAREATGKQRPASIARVYGGENNVTLPTHERAAETEEDEDDEAGS